jgi:hypothetical protein
MLQEGITTYLIQEYDGVVVGPYLLENKLVTVQFLVAAIIGKVVKEFGDLATTLIVTDLTVPNE